ncbi:MAG: hypothetical protein ACRD82_14695, partial [Blastocatellia bacterium]
LPLPVPYRITHRLQLIMDAAAKQDAGPSALVVIPGNVNYFYNQAGRRVAEALQCLGWRVHLTTLNSLPGEKFDWGFLVNVNELMHSCQPAGKHLLSIARGQCRRMSQVLLECVTTDWFTHSFEFGRRAGADYLFDLGLQDQSEQLPKAAAQGYRFVFNGLTATETQALKSLNAQEPRPIPWAFVGHQTPARVELLYRLVREFDPSGFFYVPELSPVTEDGPHLNEEQFLRVLSKTRYQIWSSHHPGIYLEGERFRASLLTGSVPVKIMLNNTSLPPDTPFSYLLVEENRLTEGLRALEFQQTRSRFVADFLSLPTLADSLSEVVNRIG